MLRYCFHYRFFLKNSWNIVVTVCNIVAVHRGGVSQHALGRLLWADISQHALARHPPPWRPLQQTVRILLECILACLMYFHSKPHVKCKFAPKFFQLVTIINSFPFVGLQKYQYYQLCVLPENSNEEVTIHTSPSTSASWFSPLSVALTEEQSASTSCTGVVSCRTNWHFTDYPVQSG